MNNVLLVLMCYFIGALPTSYIIVKLWLNKDIRSLGSGNSGATNTGRFLGMSGFFSVLIIDVAKAYTGLYLVSRVSGGDPWIVVLGAAALLLGNAYSPFISFFGGKGVATSVGVILFLFPPVIWLMYLFFFVLFIWFARRVDVAVLGATASVVLFTTVCSFSVTVIYGAVALAVWIWWRHTTNIISLWNTRRMWK